MNAMTANHAWRAHGELDVAVVVRFAGSPWAVSILCASKQRKVATIRDDARPSGPRRGDP